MATQDHPNFYYRVEYVPDGTEGGSWRGWAQMETYDPETQTGGTETLAVVLECPGPVEALKAAIVAARTNAERILEEEDEDDDD